MRLTGLKPRLGLPTLAPVLSEEQRENMHIAMKRNRALRNTTHTECIFHPKQQGFVEEGEILNWDPTHDGVIPRAYRVCMANGTSRKVNQSWLTPGPPTDQVAGGN